MARVGVMSRTRLSATLGRPIVSSAGVQRQYNAGRFDVTAAGKRYAGMKTGARGGGVAAAQAVDAAAERDEETSSLSSRIAMGVDGISAPSYEMESSSESYESSLSSSSPTPPPMTPGQMDTQNGFSEGASVAFWREWKHDDPRNGLSFLRDRVASGLASDPVSGAQYFSYHAVRTSFFMLNAYAGLFYADRSRQGAGDAMPSGLQTSSLQRALPSLGYNLGEVGAMYLQDFENIRRGDYKLPWDASVRHRQSNPLFVANKVRNFIGEAAKTLKRRVDQQAEDVWMKSRLYPDYYMNTWHYQSDGWLSSESAEVYETSTETLFLGRQDAMQRQTMLPIAGYVKEMRAAGKLPTDMSLLEVGAGTGRALTFVMDNFPDFSYTCSELSPFYLQKARENVGYYKRFRGSAAKTPSIKFVQAAAEELPVEDDSQDIVVNIYMFHELELSVLKKVVREMGRVLKPGGMLVLTDSIQLGDRPALDENLGNFTAFNEPNYTDYINLDLGKLFMDEAGLIPHTKEVGSSTKVLSFKKPVG